MGKQLRKIHSGIGDQHHLLAQRPEREEATEQVKARWRLKGRVANSKNVYNEVEANYNYYYKGQRVDMSNQSPYYVDINAHPKRCFPYTVEQHKKLPIDRLWEVRADLEASVIRRKLEYALNWSGTEMINAPIQYRIGWTASGFDDPLDVFKRGTSTNIGASNEYGEAYTFMTGSTGETSLVDTTNPHKLNGTVAHPDSVPETTTKIKLDIDVRPIPSANEYHPFTRFYFDLASNSIKQYGSSSFDREITNSRGSRDDDAIGFLFKVKRAANGSIQSGFLFLWESETRVINGRRLGNLNGFNIRTSQIIDPPPAGNKIQEEQWAFNDRTGTSANSVNRFYQENYIGSGENIDNLYVNHDNNRDRFKDFTKNRGWGENHMRVYKITNDVLSFHSAPSANAPGWTFNQWHRVTLDVNGGNVKISIKHPWAANVQQYFNIDTGVNDGTIGICNLSQAVEYKNAQLEVEGTLKGYIPESGYTTYEGESKQLAPNATEYVRASVDAAAQAAGLTDVQVSTVFAEVNSPAGRIIIRNKDAPIDIEIGKEGKETSGRIPDDGSWFEWDGFEGNIYRGNKVHATNVSDFVKQYVQNALGRLPDGFELTDFQGEVKDEAAGYVTTAFDFVAVSSNAEDAGETYYESHYKCGVQNVTPDHYDETTCIKAFNDVTALFVVEDNAFFNKRPDWDPESFIRNYEVTKPVPLDLEYEDGREILETNPNSDCVIYGPEKTEEEFTECMIDFHFDGQSLCMWSCEFPIEIDVKEFEHCVFAYEGMKTFYPLQEFEPNQWTSYKVFPQLSAIKTDLDYFAINNEQDFMDVAPGSYIEIMTSEYYEVRFPDDTPNVGEVTTEENIEFLLPSYPEHYVDPIYFRPAIDDGAKEIHFLLDVWDNNEDVAIRWITDKTPLSGVYDVNPEVPTWDGLLAYSSWHTNAPRYPVAAVGEQNKPILSVSENRDESISGRHFIQIQCLERATITEWNSGMISGSVTVNGGHPLIGGLRGYREVRGIPLNEAFIPEDVMEETIVGPIISVSPAYVDWHIESDKTLTLSSQYETPFTWYTDWLSDWNYDGASYELTYGKQDTEAKYVFDMTAFVNRPEVNLRQLIIDQIIVESDNPFVEFASIELNEVHKQRIKDRMNRTGGASIPAYGYFKKSYPYPWSPMVHSGYYYIEEQEKYLYAQREVDIIKSHEEKLSKRPRQGAPILAENKQKEMLTKTMGYDQEMLLQSHTLYSQFTGTGHAKYYMNHRNIDTSSIVVKTNGRILTEEEYMYNELDNSLQFMYALVESDLIEVEFSIKQSFYVDMYNALFDPEAQVHVSFHQSNKAEDLYNGRILYEGAMNTPFYHASEVITNPLLQNAHSGFLYIDEDTERTPNYLRVKSSQQYVDVESGEKVTLIAEVLDENQNPIEKVNVEFFENGVKVGEAETDLSGEAVLILIPSANPEYVTRVGVKVDNLHHALQINNTKPFVAIRTHIEMKANRYQIVAGHPNSVIQITGILRDEHWRPIPGQSVNMTIVNTKGETQTNALITKPNGTIDISVNAINEVRGELFVKLEHNSGRELSMNSLYIKVTGE